MIGRPAQLRAVCGRSRVDAVSRCSGSAPPWRRLHALDQPVHPVVERLERVLAEHRSLRLVVELQVDPVDGEVAPLLLRRLMNSPRSRGSGGLRRPALGLESAQLGDHPVDQALASPSGRRDPGRAGCRGRRGRAARRAPTRARGRAWPGSARSSGTWSPSRSRDRPTPRSPVSTALSVRCQRSSTCRGHRIVNAPAIGEGQRLLEVLRLDLQCRELSPIHQAGPDAGRSGRG